MRVLITGGAGFIGSHTADLLRARGHSVRVVDGLLPPVHEAARVPEYVTPDEIETGDVREKRVWERALPGVDVVFHLAAYQDYLPDFSTFFQTNTVSTALLYEVAVAQRLRLRKVIVASSQAVYGEGRYVCPRPGCRCAADAGRCYPPARDESALSRSEWEIRCPGCGAVMEPAWTNEATVNPHNSYAISKYTQELVALNLGRRYEIPTVCMRYSIVQGPRQSFRNAYSGVLRIFTQRLLTGKPPLCYEDGGQLRDYVSVFDVARANAMVMDEPEADFLALNVGGDRRISVRDYAQLIAERVGVRLPPEIPGLYRVGDTRHIVSDVGRLKALGWRPIVPLEEIVDGYVAWARTQTGFRDYSADAEARMAALGTIRRAT